MDILWSIVIAILTGVVSSFVFLFLVSRLKPKIDISPIIARGKTDNDRLCYRIKIINRTRPIRFINRKGNVINVKAKLELVKIGHIHYLRKNPLLSGDDIELRKDEIFELSPLDEKDEGETYAFRFITEENLEGKWTDTNTQFLRLRISAIDSLSNFAAVYSQCYRDKSQVFQPGNFEVGDTFEVYQPRHSSTQEYKENIGEFPVESS